MKKTIILRNMVTVLLSLTVFFLLSVTVMAQSNKSLASKSVLRIVQLTSNSFKNLDFESAKTAVSQNSSDVRITVVGLDGSVLFDSYYDANELGNHLDRPEIENAAKNTPEISVRKSDTVGHKVLYYAEKTSAFGGGEYIVRASVSYDSITSYLTRSFPLYAAVALTALIATYVISSRLSTRIITSTEHIKKQISDINNGIFTRLEKTEFEDLNRIISGINITSEKLSAAFLQAADERSKMLYILDSISAAVVAVDKSDDIIILNSYAKRMFGVNDNALNKSLQILTDDSRLIKSMGFESAATDIKIELDSNTYSLASTKLKSIDGDMKFTVLTDITDESRAEKLRSAFFANASHELKTPVTSIRGFSELLLLNNPEGKIKDYAEKINTQSIKLVDLIDDMLTLTRLETKNTSADKKMLDIYPVVKECVAALEGQAVLKNIKISISGQGKVYFDRKQLCDLLINLTENAIKYNYDHGSIYITVKDNFVSVKDTGIGIDKKERQRIFERFFRVDKGRSKKTGGTGLGLSIVKHILKENGAHILVDSQIGAGTQFKIYFAPKQ